MKSETTAWLAKLGVEVTEEMTAAGAAVIESSASFTGLDVTAAYLAKEVFLAMLQHLPRGQRAPHFNEDGFRGVVAAREPRGNIPGVNRW